MDTFSEQEPHSIIIPEHYVTQLSKVLFQHKFTANDIAAKIESNAYESLVEFQCDIMDVMHCIGVLRGGKLSLRFVALQEFVYECIYYWWSLHLRNHFLIVDNIKYNNYYTAFLR